jgi:hypothetical protein
MEEFMPIFVLRVDDGSFFLCEADNAEHARSLAKRGETYQLLDERIVSIRQLERNTFMSRWFFDDSEDMESPLFGEPEGRLEGSFGSDILEHEFPAVAEAEIIAADTPLLADPAHRNEPLLDHMPEWDAKEARDATMLRDAIRAEIRKFKKDPK